MRIFPRKKSPSPFGSRRSSQSRAVPLLEELENRLVPSTFNMAVVSFGLRLGQYQPNGVALILRIDMPKETGFGRRSDLGLSMGMRSSTSPDYQLNAATKTLNSNISST